MKHMKKRVAALLLTLAMVLSLMPMALAADEFPDMPAEDDASYAAVKSAVDNGIMTGENGNLNLEGTILRSTVSKMVVTAFAAKGEADLSGYPDVDADMWYAAWMAKANQMGIMTGTSGKMNPNSTVTLAEVAAMLVRALGLNVDKDATVDGVAAWAAPYVKALIDAGYISAEVAAAAHEPMTRGAFAEVIYKVSGEGNYAKEENAEITEDVNGNIVITANGVSLKGITVKGDVIIADGVDASSVTLDGVKIEGRLVVRGAGAELTNGTTASATVVAATTGETTVKADTSSDAGDIAVAGTNGQAADKVVIDMAEPNVTVTTATDVAVQNAKGGEVTLAAPNASLSVESGTVANVTVADGASGVKVDVAEGATIDKVTTNTDLTITGEGTVTEKEGSGTVTDAEGNEVAGSDEPVEVPSVSDPAPEVDPDAPTSTTHTHNFITETTNGVSAVIAQFDATRHTVKCVANGTETDAEGYDAGCGAVSYVAHSYDDETGACACGAKRPGTVDSEGTPSEAAEGKTICGEDNEEHPEHKWVAKAKDDDAAATCQATGKKSYECAYCGSTKTDTIAKLEHNLVLSGTTGATCGADGSQTYKCSNEGCSETKTITLPATGDHKYVLSQDPEKTVAATCQEAGKKTFVCSVCDDEQEVTLEKDENAHDWSGSWTSGEDGCTKACANDGCSEVKTKAHSSVPFTGTEDDSHKKALAPTCGTAGHTATMVCKDCDKIIVESSDIAATGKHEFATSWLSDESGHWHKCKNCDATTTSASHDSDDSCSTCGWTKGGSGSDGGEEVECQVDHTKLHVGQACSTQGCKKTGNVAHTFSNGTCTGCSATCTADTCPNKDSHSVGTKCDTCGTTPSDGG